MVPLTPAAVERAFARHGVLVSPAPKAPELCDRRSGYCAAVDIWGGKVIFLAPAGSPTSSSFSSRRSPTPGGSRPSRREAGGSRRARIVLAVEGENARAARLYEKCGFVELDAQPALPYEPHPGTRFYAYTL